MATDIGGLFTTPEQYQLAQQQAQQNQALGYAQLSPQAQAQYGFFRGGQQLGGAIAGALGAEDPELKRITQRQQIIGMIDPSNPDSYGQAIQAALQTGDTQAAYLLRNEMMAAKQQAQAQQLNEMKYQDYVLQRGQGMQAQGMANIANELIGQIKNPDGTINEDVKAKLLSFPQGRAAISELAKVVPDLRKIGAMGGAQEDPFAEFIQDPTIPKNVLTLAKQYKKDFELGIIDPEKVSDKVKSLSDMTQRIQQFEQNQQQIKANQEQMAAFKQAGLENTQGFLAIAQANQRLAQQNQTFQQQMKLDDVARKAQEAQDKAEAAKNKPLRPDLAKAEEADYEAAQAAKSLAQEAHGFVTSIKRGDIKFGLKNRAVIAGQSMLGSESPDVVNRNEFERFKTRLVNESLRLNKGTQTEGDAQRSIKELQSSENAVDAAKAINKLVEINAARVQDLQKSIERRRINANAKLPEMPIEPLNLEPHIVTDADYRKFLANPKYPKGSVFIDPEGVRRVKP